MSFAQEMKDMIGGFTAVSNAGMRMKTFAANKEYRQKTLGLNEKKLDATVKDREHRYDIADKKLGILDKGLEIKKNLGEQNIGVKKLSLDVQNRALALREKGYTDKQIADKLKINERDLAAFKNPKAAGTDTAVAVPDTAPDQYGQNAAMPQDIPVPEVNTDAETSAVNGVDGLSDDPAAFQPDQSGTYDPYMQQFARGGAVRKVYAASGGVIPEDPDVQKAIPTAPVRPPAPAARPAPVQQAAPAYADPAASGMDVTTPPAETPPDMTNNGGFDVPKIVTTAKKAVAVGMKGLVKDAQVQQEAVPSASNKKPVVDMHSTENIPTPDDITKIDKKLDPDNELKPFMKGPARLAELYQYALDKGDSEGAELISKRLLQYHQFAAKTQGGLALQALQAGNMQNGVKLLADAYDNIPDGQHLQYQLTSDGNVEYQVMSGKKIIDEGTASSAELYGMAKKVASGEEFTTRMAKIAGEADSGGDKKMTYSEAVNTAGTASKNYEELLSAYNTADPEEKKKLYSGLKEADAQNQKAMKTAQYVAQKSGNKSKDLSTDIMKRRKALDMALPADPNTDDASGGSMIPEWMQNLGSGPNVRAKQGQALPTAPQDITAPAAGAKPTSQGKPLDPGTLQAAQAAIKGGKSRAAVLKRLIDSGYSTEGL